MYHVPYNGNENSRWIMAATDSYWKKIQNLASSFHSEKLLELPSIVGIVGFSNCPYWEFLRKESLPFILSLSIVLDTWVFLVLLCRSQIFCCVLSVLTWSSSFVFTLWLVSLVEKIPGSLWSARSCTCSHAWDLSICLFCLVNSCTEVNEAHCQSSFPLSA